MGENETLHLILLKIVFSINLSARALFSSLFYFFFKSYLMSIYNLLVMTDPPDLYSLYTMIFATTVLIEGYTIVSFLLCFSRF